MLVWKVCVLLTWFIQDTTATPFGRAATPFGWEGSFVALELKVKYNYFFASQIIKHEICVHVVRPWHKNSTSHRPLGIDSDAGLEEIIKILYYIFFYFNHSL